MNSLFEINSLTGSNPPKDVDSRLFKDDPAVASFLQYIDKTVAEHNAQHKADSNPSPAKSAARKAKCDFDAKWAFLKSMVEQAEAAMATAPEGPEGTHARQKYVFWEAKLSQMQSQGGLGLSI